MQKFLGEVFSSLAKGKSLDEAFTGLKNSLLETSNMTLRDVFSSYFDMLKKIIATNMFINQQLLIKLFLEDIAQEHVQRQ